MRPGAGSRRQPNDSFIPPPTPLDFHQRNQFPRDSDASFASSRPSSAGGGAGRTRFEDYKERHFQQSVISAINSFLKSRDSTIRFKSGGTTPSAKVIIETLQFLLREIEYPVSKLEEDLPPLLKRLNYPFKLNKSILKSPAAPHQWPYLLALIHWLLQIASFGSHLSQSTSNTVSSLLQVNLVHQYTLNSYLNYIKGHDDVVEELELDIIDKLNHQKALAQEKLEAANNELKSLRDDLERLRLHPVKKEELEKTKGMLEDDVKKFNLLIEDVGRKIEEMEKVLAEKEKVLEAKEQENRRVCEENKELRRTVEAQPVNVRDVERMKRELQALEREIQEGELARNVWEDKFWELENNLSHKFKELEVLALDCNQELRRLKIGDDIQYQLNAKGTTPAEIMGFDHKLSLKPALNSYTEDIKKISMGRWEELISYQQMSNENAARLEQKRNNVATLQSQIDKMEAEVNMIKNETQDYVNRCSAEAKRMLEDVHVAGHDLDIMEREAAEVLKVIPWLLILQLPN
ncbi:kinetochore protein NDC80 homolog isoform X2 [Arachis ipaensis]|uniref:kinetochore protein NDC80 homolog isoform X2 n=1 Tax=Arachis ipaensis TaxID=130454 RepID=UPI000A2B85A0|nr:kinetochore protein NDC80 homolog isoform X2 [Arachis ipaensis]